MTVTILSPHLDDAVLSCWHLLEGGGEVTVVNVFTASPPAGTPAPRWDRLTGAEDPLTRMGERREEDRRALGRVGRDAIHLDLLDAQYGRDELSAAGLAARLRRVLAPGAVLVAPSGLGHPDHELVRDAALVLASSGSQLLLFADLPHGIGRGWPCWVSGEPGRAGVDVDAEWAAVLAGAGLEPGRLVPRVRPLDASARARKLGALAEYRTQRPALDGLAFVPLDDPCALAFEVLWDVPALAVRGRDERRDEPVVLDGPRDRSRDPG